MLVSEIGAPLALIILEKVVKGALLNDRHACDVDLSAMVMNGEFQGFDSMLTKGKKTHPDLGEKPGDEGATAYLPLIS